MRIRMAFLNMNYFIANVVTTALESIDGFMIEPYMKVFGDMAAMSDSEYEEWLSINATL